MYVVSCRKDFTSDQKLASDNLVRNYTNPHDPNVFQDMTMDQLVEKAANRHVCILVHGYRCPMENVMASYWELATSMSAEEVAGANGYGLVVGFAWPGRTTSVGYFVAPMNAKAAGPRLLSLINALRGAAHTVDVQTHSLGARVALTALRDSRKVFVDNLLLSAPAVDHNLLEPDKDFCAALNSCNRCFVYHSRNDRVLRLSYPLADISGGLKRALGLRGPRSKAVTLSNCRNAYIVDCAARVNDHGGYRKTPYYYQHWRRVLSGEAMSRYDELS